MRFDRGSALCAGVALCLGSASCVGHIGGGGGAPEPDDAMAPSSDGAAPASGPTAGARPLSRLMQNEYDNTVRDLLGDTSAPATGFTADETGASGFLTAPSVSDNEANQLLLAAEQLGQRAMTRLATLAPCAAAAADRAAEDACATQFIAAFGPRAFRRPLTDAETADLGAYYTSTRAAPMSYDLPNALRLVIEALLQSPSFLYHWELGATAAQVDHGLIHLAPYEVASRLSYYLWQSMPDDALLAAAQSGQLATSDQVAQQARRLLADPRAGQMVASFHQQWLGLTALSTVSKDPSVYPEFTPALAQSMLAESGAFASYVVLSGDGRLDTLFTAPFSIVDAPLAQLYGLTGFAGTAPQRVDLDPTQRAGLLTQPAFLTVNAFANGSNPVERGADIYQRVLCGVLPPMPNDVPAPAPPTPGESTRQRFEAHDMNPCASGCHHLMDPTGFAFEGFDGIGRFRTMDSGQPVDTSGEAILPSGARTPVRDAIELSQVLAQSADLRQCAARQWLRYGLARDDDPTADGSSFGAISAAFDASGYNVRELIVAVATSYSFLNRTPSVGEVTR